jgi:hypothetical protein
MTRSQAVGARFWAAADLAISVADSRVATGAQWVVIQQLKRVVPNAP